MSDIQNLSSKAIKPLTLLSKTNEIIDVVNEGINSSYSEKNPLLTVNNGICSWVINHNLNTEEVSCTVYEGDNEVVVNTEITSENTVTVSINSVSNITAETYSVLIVSKGGVENTHNNIQIDNSLSSTSENPVQNKVIYNALENKLNKSNYLPADTVITVRLDGSGDFTTIASAVAYLNNKWSEGNIIIDIGTGTHEVSSAIILTSWNNSQKRNFARIIVKGQGVDSTIIKNTGTSSGTNYIFEISGNPAVIIHSLTFQNTGNVKDVITVNREGHLTIQNCKFKDVNLALYAHSGGEIRLENNLTFNNVTSAIRAYAGTITGIFSANITFDTVENCYQVKHGGIIRFYYSVNCTYTNITKKYSQTVGTATTDGWIAGV